MKHAPVKHLGIATTIMLSLFLFLTTLFYPHSAFAADFEIFVEKTYTVAESGTIMHITERRTLRNESPKYVIPQGSSELFTIQNFKEGFDDSERSQKESSIRVTNAQNRTVSSLVSLNINDISIEVTYPTDINYGQSYAYTLEYDSNELIESVGSITNIYIPGLSSSYQSSMTDPTTKTTTQIIYTTTLKVPKILGDAAFTLPTPESQTESESTIDYSFTTDSLVDTTVWHQIGTHQTYFFRMTQPIKQSDTSTPSSLSFLSKAQYQLILPRDYSETNQEVRFTRLEPKPNSITIDTDGNTIATYYLDATKDSSIIVEGYITVSVEGSNQNQRIASTATIDQIDTTGSLGVYLEPALYWESDSPEIIAKAQELAGVKSTILEILKADYTFIVQSIDYDDFKYGDRNTRRGALATLKGGSSVCMEYSDLLIALARAQGIPARAAYGYGYDPSLLPDEQEEHQWVQAWIPEYGWLTIDPTWGETGRQFIGQDLDHALWYVASLNPNIPSPLTVTAAETDFSIVSSSIEITAIQGIPNNETTQTLSEITEEIKLTDNSNDEILRKIQTSMMGRTLVIVLPVVALLIVFSICAKVIEIIYKKITRRRNTTSPSALSPN